MGNAWAHRREEDGEIHDLIDHLYKTAILAGDFAEPFDCSDWGYFAGLLHDLGKYSPEFQAYLLSQDGADAHIEHRKGSVDHSQAGALHVSKQMAKTAPNMGRVLAHCLAGHHTGLTDWDTSSNGSLAKRLNTPKPETHQALTHAATDLLTCSAPATMPKLQPGDHCAFQMSVLTRMLFSCLTDADFLDTEAFMDAEKTVPILCQSRSKNTSEPRRNKSP